MTPTPVSAPATSHLGASPLLRLTLPAVLVLAEVTAASAAFDTSSLEGKGALAAFVASWASSGARFLLLLVVAAAVFGVPKWRPLAERFRALFAASRVDWRWLLVHVAAAAVLVPVAVSLFGNEALSAAPVWVAAAAALTIVASVAAVLWVLPVSVLSLAATSLGGGWALAGAAAFAATFGGSLSQALWRPSASLTFAIVRVLLAPFLPDVVADPNRLTIGSGMFAIRIAPDCSGYEGVAMALAFSACWLWYFRREYRFPAALLLVPAAAGAMWVLNSFRIAALILIGHAGAPEVARGGFHSQAGWLAFIGVAVGLCLLSKRVALFAMEPEARGAGRGAAVSPVAAYLVPFLAVLAASMISKAASGQFEWLYPLRFVAAAGALWFYRREYVGVKWRPGPLSVVAGVLVFAIWVGLDRSAPAAMNPELASMPAPLRVAWLGLRVLGAVITVPIAEELAFRGFLMRRLVAEEFELVSWRRFAWMPFVMSSLAFGALHGSRWVEGTLAGMVYAGVMLRSGRLGDAVVAHAITNAILASLVLIGGQWQYW